MGSKINLISKELMVANFEGGENISYKSSGTKALIDTINNIINKDNQEPPVLTFVEHSYFCTTLDKENTYTIFIGMEDRNNTIDDSLIDNFIEFFTNIDTEIEGTFPVLWHEDFLNNNDFFLLSESSSNNTKSIVKQKHIKPNIQSTPDHGSKYENKENYNHLELKEIKNDKAGSKILFGINKTKFNYLEFIENLEKNRAKSTNQQDNKIVDNIDILRSRYDDIFKKEEKNFSYKYAVPISGSPYKVNYNNKEIEISIQGSVWIYVINRNIISEEKHKKIGLAVSKIARDLSINYIFKKGLELADKARAEAIKSAVSAIMARNMSHNLGSHVITNTKNEIKKIADELVCDMKTSANFRGLSELLQYLQERQDFIAMIANGEKYSQGPVHFKSAIFDLIAADGLSIRHSSSQPITNYILNNIVKSENVYRELKPIEEINEDDDDVIKGFRARKQCNNGIVSENIEQYIKLELSKKVNKSADANKRSTEVDKNYRNLDTDIKKTYINNYYYNREIEYINGRDIFNKIVNKFNKENESKISMDIRLVYKKNDQTFVFDSFGGGDDSYKFADIMMGIPYGLSGRHAILSIIENVIRNSAKHNELTRILAYETLDNEGRKTVKYTPLIISLIIEDVGDMYQMTISDNLGSLANVMNRYKNEIKILDEDYNFKKLVIIDQNGGIDKNYKGLKEMLICLSWMSGSTEFHEIQDNKEAINHLLEVVGVKYEELGESGGTIKRCNIHKPTTLEELGGYSLGYRFHIGKYKEYHFIDTEAIVDSQDGIYSLKPGWKDSLPASYMYVVSNDIREDIKVVIERVLPRVIFLKGKDNEDVLDQYFQDHIHDTQRPYLYINDDQKQATNIGIKYKDEIIIEDGSGRRPDKKNYIEFATHYETRDAERKDDNIIFVEGISGGNYTHNLVRTSIDDKSYIKIVEAAYTKIAIIDERIYEANRGGKKDSLFREKGVYILNSVEDGTLINLSGNNCDQDTEFSATHIDYISIHYSLIEKMRNLGTDIAAEGNTIVNKLTKLFSGYKGITPKTKIAIHSGRGGMNNIGDIAFIPLSGLEWPLNNCKYILVELFAGQKYSAESIIK